MAPLVDRRSVSWKAMFLYVALPIIFGVGGFLVSDIYAEVKALRELKLDKQEFYSIVAQLDKKTDLILQLLRDRGNSERRR